MVKKFQLKTISLGSEPDTPSISDLKEFISRNKGIEADLVTYQMLHSYSAQRNAGIDDIGIGGRFCRPRMEEGLSWNEEQGPQIDPRALVMDYSLLTREGVSIRSVHESPAVFTSSPSADDEDAFAEICHGFRQLLRILRDHRISGHIIHIRNPSTLELELLSSPKIQLFLHDPTPLSLADLLEHTSDLILQADRLPLMDELMDQYKVQTLSVCDAEESLLLDALQYVDPDHLKVGGYCMGSEDVNWKKVKDLAVISV